MGRKYKKTKTLTILKYDVFDEDDDKYWISLKHNKNNKDDYKSLIPEILLFICNNGESINGHKFNLDNSSREKEEKRFIKLHHDYEKYVRKKILDEYKDMIQNPDLIKQTHEVKNKAELDEWINTYKEDIECHIKEEVKPIQFKIKWTEMPTSCVKNAFLNKVCNNYNTIIRARKIISKLLFSVTGYNKNTRKFVKDIDFISRTSYNNSACYQLIGDFEELRKISVMMKKYGLFKDFIKTHYFYDVYPASFNEQLKVLKNSVGFRSDVMANLSFYRMFEQGYFNFLLQYAPDLVYFMIINSNENFLDFRYVENIRKLSKHFNISNRVDLLAFLAMCHNISKNIENPNHQLLIKEPEFNKCLIFSNDIRDKLNKKYKL